MKRGKHPQRYTVQDSKIKSSQRKAEECAPIFSLKILELGSPFFSANEGGLRPVLDKA